MSRQPTPQEIAETNQNITRQCDSCHTTLVRNPDFRTFDNALTLTITGGYGEFIDTLNMGEEFFICHQCGHELMANMFSTFDITGWHPKTEDPFCDGWTI